MMQWSYDTLLKWGTDELTAHDVENAAAGCMVSVGAYLRDQSSGFPDAKK